MTALGLKVWNENTFLDDVIGGVTVDTDEVLACLAHSGRACRRRGGAGGCDRGERGGGGGAGGRKAKDSRRADEEATCSDLGYRADDGFGQGGLGAGPAAADLDDEDAGEDAGEDGADDRCRPAKMRRSLDTGGSPTSPSRGPQRSQRCAYNGRIGEWRRRKPALPPQGVASPPRAVRRSVARVPARGFV